MSQVRPPECCDSSLAEQIKQAGVEVSACYQCGRCSSGCPVAPFFDNLPMEVVRLTNYGMEEELLQSETIWLCASCETCTTRCPNKIDIAHLMDQLRTRALANKSSKQQKKVQAFHRSFLRSIRRWGRTYEVGMLAAYKFRSGDLFGDLGLGWRMFRRGKLRLMPRGIRGKRQLKALFRKTKEEHKE